MTKDEFIDYAKKVLEIEHDVDEVGQVYHYVSDESIEKLYELVMTDES